MKQRPLSSSEKSLALEAFPVVYASSTKTEELENAKRMTPVKVDVTEWLFNKPVADDLVDFLNKKLKASDGFYASVREKQMGDPDLKPSASWKKTLWISAPKATLTGPTLQNKFTTEVNVLGQGSAMVTCGLVPRVNAFLYDMVGVFAGVRGSIVAKGEYSSECTGASNFPTGKVSLGLSADLGVQIGGRLQAPGASIFGIAGQVAGLNVGPLEPFKINIPLYKGEWSFKKGLGWCSTSCGDMVFNGNETDLDCGGGCNPCTVGKKCAENTDCLGAVCNGVLCGPDTCSDKVQDGDETDIDCGGSCAANQNGLPIQLQYKQ